MPPVGDKWVEEVAQKDPQVFDQLFLKYKTPVYRFAFYLTQNHSEADDLFQETWLRVIKHLISKTMIRDFSRVFILVVIHHEEAPFRLIGLQSDEFCHFSKEGII